MRDYPQNYGLNLGLLLHWQKEYAGSGVQKNYGIVFHKAQLVLRDKDENEDKVYIATLCV